MSLQWKQWIKITLNILFLQITTIFGDCTEPPPVPNAYRYTDSNSYLTNGAVNYSCYMNHIKIGGHEQIICQSDGTFQPAALECKLSCGKPRPVEGTEYDKSISSQYLAGDTIKYHCIANQSLSLLTTCNETIGRWDSAYFLCSGYNNLALNRRASLYPDTGDNGKGAELAVDGEKTDDKCSETGDSLSPSFEVILVDDINDMLLDLHEVRLTLQTKIEDIDSITVTPVTTWEDKNNVCNKVNAPFPVGEAIYFICPPGAHGIGINVSATFIRGTPGRLTICEVEVFGKTRNTDCGFPTFVYGANATFSNTSRTATSLYYCLSEFGFVNRGSGHSGDSTCWANHQWSPPTIKCAYDQQDESIMYPEGLECLYSENGEEYKGMINTSVSGATCERWDRVPNGEELNFPDNPDTDGTNYCRNPTGVNTPTKEKPWCWVRNYTATEYCPIAYCNEICALYPDMYDYVGNLSISVSGTTCIQWDAKALFTTDVFPDKARNHDHCRNPGRSQDQAWCYVSLEDNSFEACDIPRCPVNYKEIAITKSDSYLFEVHTCHIWYHSSTTSPAMFVYSKKLDQSQFDIYCSRFNISYVFCNVLNLRQSPADLNIPAWVRFLVDCDKFTSSSASSTSYTTAIPPVTVADSSSDISSLSLTITSPCSDSSIMDSSESSASSMQSTTTTHPETSLNMTSNLYPSDQQTLVTTPLLSDFPYSSIATFTPILSNIAQPLSQPSASISVASILNSLNPSDQQIFVTTPSLSNSLYSSVTPSTPVLPRTTKILDQQLLSQPPSLSSLSTLSPSPIRPDASLATPVSNRKFCACSCRTGALTGAKLSENIQKVAKELTIEKKTLSASIRKITSAVDNRPSAVSMGYTGIILLTMALVIMIVPDLANVFYFLKNKTRHHELE